MDDWHKQRRAELKAAAPVKHKKHKKTEHFVIAPLQQAVKACAAVNCPKAMVWLWLKYRERMTGQKIIAVPNGALAKCGVGRNAKNRALEQLEMAGVIALELHPRKTPIATLL
jgi:hypothetical protein